jgi:hypothetical protein
MFWDGDAGRWFRDRRMGFRLVVECVRFAGIVKTDLFSWKIP